MMDSHDFNAYWVPACIKLGLTPNTLDDLLDVDEFKSYAHRRHSEDTPMNEDLKRLLIMLVGPHGKAILKAYRIQKGLVS